MTDRTAKCVNKGTKLILKFCKYLKKQDLTEEELDDLFEALKEVFSFISKLSDVGE